MKKDVTEKKPFCDWCEEPANYGCAGCDKDVCHDCRDQYFKGFMIAMSIDPSAVYPVCNECIENPTKNAERIKAAQVIDAMIQNEFKRREEIAGKIKEFAESKWPKE